jgi:hypothetical protein
MVLPLLIAAVDIVLGLPKRGYGQRVKESCSPSVNRCPTECGFERSRC